MSCRTTRTAATNVVRPPFHFTQWTDVVREGAEWFERHSVFNIGLNPRRKSEMDGKTRLFADFRPPILRTAKYYRARRYFFAAGFLPSIWYSGR
jgi:hypothetical protein